MNITVVKSVSRTLKDFQEYEKVFTVPDSVGNDQKKIINWLKSHDLLEDDDNWEEGMGGQDYIDDDEEIEYSLGEITGSKSTTSTIDEDEEDMINVIITKVITRNNKSSDNFLKEFSIPANVGTKEKKIIKYLQDNDLLADDNDWDSFDGSDIEIQPGDRVDYYLEEIRED